jgi:hypothetical protein
LSEGVLLPNSKEKQEVEVGKILRISPLEVGGKKEKM